MSDEYAKHYDLDMPVSLFERLKEQSIYFFLKQAQEIVNGQDLPQNLRNGLFNGCTTVWDFPEPLLPKWLGYRSGSSTAIREPSGRYSGRFVNIGGSAPWVGGEVYLLPVVQIPKIGFRIANRTRNLDQGIWYFTEDERFQQTGQVWNQYAKRIEKKPYEDFFPPLGTPDHAVDEISKELSDAVSTMAQGPIEKEVISVAKGSSEVVIDIEPSTTAATPPEQRNSQVRTEAVRTSANSSGRSL
jgi:hypothetical protein